MEIISSERLSKKLESLRQKGTNILKYLDLQKSWRVFLRDLPENLDEITVRFGLFISAPQNKKILEESLGLDAIKDREKIIALLLHPESRAHIQKQKISIALDILTG